MENLSGKSIKGYELRERIGAGGFGAVYRASQSTVGREVAVKIILPYFANNPDFIRRFEIEAQLVARLEHLHIVPLYDYWRDPNGAYLVMRWLKGGSLRDALSNGPFAPEAAALLLDQVGSALAAAHRSNVIHRDLKPGNILLDEDGNAYLADFGIAKDVGSSGHITEPDAIVGSPDYLAPEQARAEQVTPRTDIYSLGVVLYEILTGQHPFPNLSMVERLYKHLNEPLPEITSLNDDISNKVNTVIQKATAKNPEHRYADTQELAAAFRAAIHSVTGNAVVETLTQREQEVLQLIIKGDTNGKIAEKLFISITTVRWYIRQIYQKLGVRSRVQAIIRARDLNLITKPDSPVNSPAIPTDQFRPDNPYKGLRAFQAADHQDFFGREKLVDKLLNRLADTTDTDGLNARFLAVIGPSGSGKSSLVKAGLIPAIWRGAISGSEKWFVVEMMPGSHPLEELEIALSRVAANQVTSLNEHLMRDERGLLRAAGLILPNDGSELMIVIDQFEEVFTLVQDEDERVHFLNLILTAVNDPRSRVRVVITLRADFYDRPLYYERFGELVRSRMETVLPLSAEGLERAIARPAERVGVSFEPGLVAAIIGEINYQAGALPLLQYALTELFEHRKGRLLTHEAYQEIGRTTGALAKRAEQIYLELPPEGQEAARQMFLRLVTLGEGAEDTRRRAARSELLAITQDTDRMDEIIDTYAEYRLLSLDNDAGTRTPTVEVAHEAILREWERLRMWLNDSREDIRLQRQLAAMTAEWATSQQDGSFLLRGSRLEQFEKWAAETQLALTAKEQTYLQNSLKQRSEEKTVEEERLIRVKALEKRSVRFLRVLVTVLVLAVLSAFGLTSAAVTNANQAQNARATSVYNAQIAQENALAAQNALATSDANFRQAEKIRLAVQAQNLINDGSNGNLPALLALSSLQYGYSEEADAALMQASSLGIIKKRFPSTSISNGGVFSPDGKRAVTVGTDLVGRVWDVETGQQIMELSGSTGTLITVSYAPNGQYIAAAGSDTVVYMWEAKTGKLLRQLSGHTDVIWSLAISPDSLHIISSGADKTVRLWDTQTGNEIRQMAGAAAIDISPNGRYFLTGDTDSSVRLWDMTDWREIRQFKGHSENIQSVAFSPDGNLIATGSDDKTAIIWDVNSGEEIYKLIGHTEWVGGIEFSPDSKVLVSTSADFTIRFWNVQTGKQLKRFYAPDNPILAVAYSPDGKYILSNGQPDALLWDAQFEPEPKIIGIEDHPDDTGPWRIKYSLDQQYFLTGSPSMVEIWDAKTFEKMHEIHSGFSSGIRAAALSPDNKYIFANIDGGSDPNAYLYDVASGNIVQTFVGHAALQNDVDYSPDGKYAASTSFDNTAIVWDIQTGEPVLHLKTHTAATDSVAFSADSRQLLLGSTDGTADLWDIATGKQLQLFADDAAAVMYVAFSPDEKRVATSHFDGTFRIWDIETGEVLQKMSAHATSLGWGVMFSHDGRYLLGSERDRNVRLWDTQTGELVRIYAGHSGNLNWAIFSPDEKQILAVGGGEIVIWQRNSGDFASLMCGELPEDFTDEQRQAYLIPEDQHTCAEFATEPSG